MFTSFCRLSGIAVVMSCSLTQSNSADVAPHPRSVPFTAFPELKPQPIDSDSVIVVPDLPADAPPLGKVRHAQAIMGIRYLIQMRGTIHDGWWSDTYLPDLVMMTTETYRAAAEAEDALANRVPWYQERVRAMKSIEHFIENRVRSGTASPLSLHLTRFTRYQCEVDLLRLMDEVAKTNNTKGRPLIAQSIVVFLRDTKQLTYTAFPELKALLRVEPPIPQTVVPNLQVVEVAGGR